MNGHVIANVEDEIIGHAIHATRLKKIADRVVDVSLESLSVAEYADGRADVIVACSVFESNIITAGPKSTGPGLMGAIGRAIVRKVLFQWRRLS